MLSIVDFEPEVVSLILEFVNDTSPRTTNAVACVNRYFNEITKVIAHRHKNIHLRGNFDEEIVDLIQSWTSDATILANIRTLKVTGRIEDAGGTESRSLAEEVWDPLVALVSSIGKLRRFEWNIKYPIPMTVFDAFETHQKASTLRVYNFTRVPISLKEPDDLELRLAKSTALTHLRTVSDGFFGGGLQGWPGLQEVAFRMIVASAPNLEYAGLVRPSWTIGNDDADKEIEKWKPLFYTHKKPSTSVKQLTLDGFILSKETLQDWSSTVNLASLQNLKFSRGFPKASYFEYASGALPNLKHLSLNLRNMVSMDGVNKPKTTVAIQNYIKDCAPLQTLSLWSWMGTIPLQDVLDRHGPTLQSLQLHEREDTAAPRLKSSILSLQEIRSIRTSCPHLRDFTFDLARYDPRLRRPTETKNMPYYDELAQMPHLTHLQIYFDAGLMSCHSHNSVGNGRYVSREVDDTSSEDESSNDDYDDRDNEDDNDSTAPRKRVRLATTDDSDDDNDSDGDENNNGDDNDDDHVPPHPVSRTQDQRRMAKQIWTRVFGHRFAAAACHLDVKFGEWEAYVPDNLSRRLDLEVRTRRHLIVQSHERDDVAEPAVTVLRKEKQLVRDGR